MSTIALPVSFPKFQAIGTNGPLAGYQVFTYLSGTTTPAVTYGAVDGSVTNTNPIILDSLGEATIMLPFNTIYKFVIVDPNTAVTVTTIDPVYANTETGAGDFTLSGNLIIKNFSIEDAYGNIYINFASAGASSVNGMIVRNATTGNSPSIEAAGTDPNINLKLKGQGTGTVTTPSGYSASNGFQFLDNKGLLDSNGNVLLVPVPTAAAVNGVGIINGPTGTPVRLIPAGPSVDASTDLELVGKGTGLPSTPNGFKLQTVSVTSGSVSTGMSMVASSPTAASFAYNTNLGPVVISGTPSVGYAPVATSSTTALWSAVASGSTNSPTNFLVNPNFWVWQNNTDASGGGGTGSANINANSPARLFIHDRWTINTNNTSAGSNVRLSAVNPAGNATFFTPDLNPSALDNLKLTMSATGGVFNLAQSLTGRESAAINTAINTIGSGTAYVVFSALVARNAGTCTVTPFIYTKTNGTDTDLLSSSGGIAANWSVASTTANTVTLSTSLQLVYCFVSVTTSSDFTNYAVGFQVTSAGSSDSLSITAAACNVVSSITNTSGVPVLFSSRNFIDELQYCQSFVYTGLASISAVPSKQLWPSQIGASGISFEVPAITASRSSNFNICIPIPNIPFNIVTLITIGSSSGQLYNVSSGSNCTGSSIAAHCSNSLVYNFGGGSTQSGDLIGGNLLIDNRPQ